MRPEECAHEDACMMPSGVERCWCGAERRTLEAGWTVSIHLEDVEPVDTIRERGWDDGYHVHVPGRMPLYPEPDVDLYELRQRLHLSLAEAAVRLGMTPQQVAELECGWVRPVGGWERVLALLEGKP